MTIVRTKTMLYRDYSVDSKWLFLFLFPCFFSILGKITSLWLFHLVFAFSYLSIIIAEIIQKCWKSAQKHHNSSAVTTWSIKQGLPKRTSLVMSEWDFHWHVFLYSDAIENACFKVLVSITVHYIERIKELQEVWSTRFQDCFGSITLCSSRLFLQCEETYTITIDPK